VQVVEKNKVLKKARTASQRNSVRKSRAKRKIPEKLPLRRRFSPRTRTSCKEKISKITQTETNFDKGASEFWRVVFEGKIRVRKCPRINTKVLRPPLEFGEIIEVTEKNGKWVRHKGGWSLSEDDDFVLMVKVGKHHAVHHICDECGREFCNSKTLGKHAQTHKREK